MKFKNKYKLITLLFFGAIMLLSVNNSSAVRIEKYKLIGTTPENIPNGSPPAYQIYDSEYFPDGTILYKQTYYDVTYYSPKPPEDSVEANDSTKSAKYKNWDFYKFKPNQTKNPAVNAETIFRTNKYYSQATVTKDAIAYGCDNNGQVAYTKTLTKGTVLDVKSISIIPIYNYSTGKYDDIEFLFFSTSGTGLNSYNKIGRIETKYVKKTDPNETTKKVYFEEVKDRTTTVSSTSTKKCSDYYDNFKPYRTTVQRYNGSAFDKLVKSPNKVADTVTTCKLGGKSGEWKYLGVSSKGNIIANPYYPGDQVNFLGNGSLKYYDWRITPWKASSSSDKYARILTTINRQSKLNADAESFRKLYDAQTYFDLNMEKKKIEMLQEIIDDIGKPVNGSNKTQDKLELSATDWADRVSLLTNPFDETPIFVGQRRLGDYTQPFAYIKPVNDLYLSSIVIKDSKGTTVASGTRTSYNGDFKLNAVGKLKKGGYYTVEVKLSKKIKDALKSNTLVSGLKITNSESKNVSVLPSNTAKLTNKGGLVKDVNTSDVMVYAFQVPENYTGTTYKIKGFVGVDHTGIDNLDYTNDEGLINIGIVAPPESENGDIKALSIKLLDGTTVVYDSTASANRQAIVPGKKYNIVYTAQYIGETLCSKTFNGTKWVDDISNPYKSTVPLSYSITRKVGSTQSNDGTTKTAYFIDSSGNKTISMIKNTTFTYTVSNIMLEHPYLDTNFTITSTNKKINNSTANDNISKKINDVFEIVISNLRVLPSKEYTLGKNTYTYNVIYDAKLTTPSYVTSSNYKTLVNTSININGTEKKFVDILKPNTVIKNISHSVSGISIGTGTGPYYCEVVLNYDKKEYDNGGRNNNKKTTSINFEKVKDPSLGKASDKAKAPYNGANTLPNKGGDANNNCLIPRNTNTYSNTYNIYNWNTTNVSYTSFSGANSINFYKYNILSEKTKTTTNKENFVIKDVLFRSKYTKDNKLGTKKDGWVSMINSTDSKIKAGYGFELKVIVEYKTNALLNNPDVVDNKTSGTFVTNLNSGINVTPEIFVEIPGTKTKTILSVNKYTGTKQGLSVKQTKKNVLEGSMHVSEWEYTIKGTNTSGIQGAGKIFIPENLKDGNYKLSIYTPPVSGVSSSSEYDTFKYSSLCDRKDTNVTVSGSATDDLNSHTTQ